MSCSGPCRDAEVLTAREQEVVAWAVQGMTNKEIAAQLGVSANRENAFTKRFSEVESQSTRATFAAFPVSRLFCSPCRTPALAIGIADPYIPGATVKS